MTRAYRKQRPTKELILQAGLRLFLEKGYTTTPCAGIAKELNISPGNLTFYFPTKEHLLTELVQLLWDYQGEWISASCPKDWGLLRLYCIRLIVLASLCAESVSARTFYLSAYTHPMPLAIIRQKDAVRAGEIFREYCPDCGAEDFLLFQHLVSGIEYGVLSGDREEPFHLKSKLYCALEQILRVYHVPEGILETEIDAALRWDCSAVCRELMPKFQCYVDAVSEKALEQALEYQHRKTVPPSE